MSPAKVCVFLGVWLGAQAAAGAAAPVGIIFADLDSDPAQREVAGSLGILVRSMLGPGQRALVPIRELALALEVLNSGRRQEALIVEPAQARALMDRLTADRTFIGRLSLDETRWEVRGPILGPGGDRIGSVSVQVPPHELNQLATLLAQRLAARLGLQVVERPPVTLDALRPYARAQAALNSGDVKGAAGLLENADPRPVASFSPARQVVDSVAANPGVPAPARMQMSLLAGDNNTAKQIAEEILTTQPKHVQAHAGKARALAGLGDMEGAVTELASIKTATRDPFAAAANAALLVKRRYSSDRSALGKGKLSEEEQEMMLATTFADPDSDARPTLAFLSSAGPNALPANLEGAALGAAERVARKDPGLAAGVATRALKGGVEVDRALPLANIQQLDRGEVALVQERLDGLGPRGDKAKRSLGEELEQRDGAAQKLRLGGLDLQPRDAGIQQLAGQLRGLLANFGILQEQVGPRIMIVAKEASGASWYLPFDLRRTRLQHGLWRAAWDKPYEMGLVSPPSGAEVVAEGMLTEVHLGTLLDKQGGDLVLVWSARSKGLQVAVELTLFDGASGTAYRTSGSVAGMSNSLLSLNFIPLGFLVGLIAVPVGLIRMRRKAGTVLVRLQAKEAADRLFCLIVSHSPKPPRITNPQQHADEMDKLGAKQVKLSASLVEDRTMFEKVPPGHWYVHLYGTYRTGKIVHVLAGEEFSQRVEVKSAKETQVVFALSVSSAEFHVTVHDKSRPLTGVPVWIDNDRDKALLTNDEGLVVLKVALGQRILRLEAGGMFIEKTLVVVKKNAHVIAINLDWERKVDDVSRALDNDPEVIAARGSSANLPRQPNPAIPIPPPDLLPMPDEHSRG